MAGNIHLLFVTQTVEINRRTIQNTKQPAATVTHKLRVKCRQSTKHEKHKSLSVSFKLTVTVTEMANNWNILNQLTVTATVTEIRLVTEM